MTVSGSMSGKRATSKQEIPTVNLFTVVFPKLVGTTPKLYRKR